MSRENGKLEMELRKQETEERRQREERETEERRHREEREAAERHQKEEREDEIRRQEAEERRQREEREAIERRQREEREEERKRQEADERMRKYLLEAEQVELRKREFERQIITGSAVAHHCYNGDVRIPMGKIGNLTSCKIKTLEQIVAKFVTVQIQIFFIKHVAATRLD